MTARDLLIIAGALIVLSACASLPVIADRPPLDLSVEPGESAFRLSLANPSGDDRCIASDLWPTRGGQLDFASERVYVEDDGRRFSIRDENTGYCPDCQVRVPANSSITATLPYSEFPGLAESPPGPHATLTLPIAETPCRATT